MLGKLGLSFDNYHPDYTRLPTLAKLGQKFPEVTIIVNHLGGKVDPNASTGDIAEWRECIGKISKCPNVHSVIVYTDHTLSTILTTKNPK